MSLNSSMSFNNATSSSTSSSSRAPPTFPLEHERRLFPTWSFKFESFIASHQLTMYLNSPILLDGEQPASNTTYIGERATAADMNKHRRAAIRAHDFLIQSLHETQINLIRDISLGHVYEAYNKLKTAYGMQRSTTQAYILIEKMYNNKKHTSERITDYLSRTDRLLLDIHAIDPSFSSMKWYKFIVLKGLSDSPEWRLFSSFILEADPKDEWTKEEFHQKLISHEEKVKFDQAKYSRQPLVNDDHSTHSSPSDQLKSYYSRGDHRGSFRGRSRGRGRFHQSHHNSDRSSQSSSNQSFDRNHRHNNHQHHRGRGNHQQNSFHRSPSSYESDKAEDTTCFNCGGIGHFSSKCASKPHTNASQHSNRDRNQQHYKPSSQNNRFKRRSFNGSQAHHAAYDSDQDEPSEKRQRTSSQIDEESGYASFVVITQPASATSSHSSQAMHSSSFQSTDLYLDSGATDHYVGNISLLTDIVKISPPRSVTTANGLSSSDIMGTIIINNNHHRVTLKEVLYIPDFKANLISVAKIVKTGAKVTYDITGARVVKKNITLLSFDLVDNMFILSSTKSSSSTKSLSSAKSSSSSMKSTTSSSFITSVSSPPTDTTSVPSTTLSSSISSLSSDTTSSVTSSTNDHDTVTPPSNNVERIARAIYDLHIRHGHINYSRIMKMINNNSIVIDKPIRIISHNQVLKALRQMLCKACIKGKMSRSPVTGVIDRKVSNIMDMWVVDLMVPTIPTRSGNKYIILIMDVYSGYLIIGFIKTKDETTPFIIKIIKLFQTQLKKTLLHLHHDQGKEIMNATLAKFLDDQGTKRTTSAAYTPEHNALIERANRTIIETGNTLMHHANAHVSLYGEAYATAVWHRNRSTNVRNDNLTAHEVMRSEKADLSNIHVFGCDVYYYQHKVKRENKFSSKALAGIFVGYDEYNDKYYRILNVDTQTIVLSRDVKFRDNEFTEMKRLNMIMNDSDSREQDDNDTNTMIRYDDIIRLPDSVPPSAIADMFDGGRTRQDNERSNDNNQSTQNNQVNHQLTDERTTERLTSTRMIGRMPKVLADSPSTVLMEQVRSDERTPKVLADSPSKVLMELQRSHERMPNALADSPSTRLMEQHGSHERTPNVLADSPSTGLMEQRSNKRKPNVLADSPSMVLMERANKRMNERTNERTSEQVNDSRMNERTNEQVNDSRMNERTSEQVNDNMNIDTDIIPVNIYDERPAPTRTSTRVTAKPFQYDPSSYNYLVIEEREPQTFKQAMNSKDRDKWLHAIFDEFDAHKKNKTWTIVRRTKSMRTIGSKWVFKIKMNADGVITKFKARLVAKGYNQQQGVDFHETFSPVLKYKSIRIIIVLSIHFNMFIKQFDVKTTWRQDT
jgi:hypothetical protein